VWHVVISGIGDSNTEHELSTPRAGERLHAAIISANGELIYICPVLEVQKFTAIAR
jgi:hypothetical protein